MVRFQLTAAALICAVFVAGVEARRPASPLQESRTIVTASSPINLNTATAADLQKLPGIGASIAARILEYRQKSGGFKKVEELMNVRGIGEKNFLKLKPLVTVTPVKTAER
jgi:competence protein ComEA